MRIMIILGVSIGMAIGQTPRCEYDPKGYLNCRGTVEVGSPIVVAKPPSEIAIPSTRNKYLTIDVPARYGYSSLIVRNQSGTPLVFCNIEKQRCWILEPTL